MLAAMLKQFQFFDETFFSKIIATFLGPTLLGLGLYRLYLEIRPRRWVNVPSVVTQSRIERQYTGRGSYQSVPIIEFEYDFNGITRRFTAEFFSIGSYDSAAKIVANFQLKQNVHILVNPKNPQQAALGCRITPASMFFILVGAFLTAIEIAFHKNLVPYLLF